MPLQLFLVPFSGDFFVLTAEPTVKPWRLLYRAWLEANNRGKKKKGKEKKKRKETKNGGMRAELSVFCARQTGPDFLGYSAS